MRKFLFLFLRLSGSWNRLCLRLRKKTEGDLHDERIVSGRAWSDFCDELKAAGNLLLDPGVPRDPFQQAEGFRYLTRLTRAGLEAFVEFGNPACPELRSMVHETVKMGADNPDNHYMNAQISGSYEYLISGKRNTVDYLSFHTRNGNYGTSGGLTPCGELNGSDLVLDKNGNFEIFVGREPKANNWLKTDDETSLLIVRQTFADREKEQAAEMRIVNLEEGACRKSLSTEQVSEGLKTASLFVGGSSLLFKRWAKGFRKHTNTLPQFDPEISNNAGGDPTIIYYHSYWKLAPDEALLIQVMPPSCDTWNFQLNNYWMESLDYRHHRISINRSSASYEKDGSLKVIVSHSDPGHPNWIETAGHSEGTMCWRWYRLHEGEQPVEPACTVHKLNDLVLHE